MIHYYFGYGKGKTSSSIGLGMRAKGADKKVTLIQFFKDSNSSELSTVPFDVYKAPNTLPFNPGEEYQEWFNSAIGYFKESDSSVIILDEFIDVVDKFISLDETIEILNLKNSQGIELVLTGHREIEELMSISDYVTEFKKIKHPYDKGVKARKGIEY